MATKTETVQMRPNMAEVVWVSTSLSQVKIFNKNTNLLREVGAARSGDGHVSLHCHTAVAADRRHDGHVSHEVGNTAEIRAKHPVSITTGGA